MYIIINVICSKAEDDSINGLIELIKIIVLIGLIPLAIISLIIIFLIVLLIRLRMLKRKNIKESNPKIRSTSGLIFGKFYNIIMNKDENKEGHVLVVGEEGIGKTSCMAMPSLINWSGTALVIDAKGDFTEKAFRKNVKIFEPGEGIYAYDILYRFKVSENKIQEAKFISESIMYSRMYTKNNSENNSETTYAKDFLTACILCWSNENFVTICRNIRSYSKEILLGKLISEGNADVKILVSNLNNLNNEELTFAYNEMISKTVIFVTDEQLMKACSSTENNITPEDLDNGFDIILRIRESKLDAYQSLLAIIIDQFVRYFEKRKSQEKVKPILFLMDEFAKIGKQESLVNKLSTLKSRNISVCLIIRSFEQAKKIYTENEINTIVKNCEYKLVYQLNDKETSEYFSEYFKDKHIKYSDEAEIYSFQNAVFALIKTMTNIVKSKMKMNPEKFFMLGDYVILSKPDGNYKLKKVPYHEICKEQKKI